MITCVYIQKLPFFKENICKFDEKRYYWVVSIKTCHSEWNEEYIIFKDLKLYSSLKRSEWHILNSELDMHIKNTIIIGMLLALGLSFTQALMVPDSTNQILNQNDQQVLDSQGITDPIRDGAYKVIDSQTSSTGKLGGIIGVWSQISNHQTAQNQTLQVIKNVVNYALWLIALIALIYLIYHGILILTAAGDDAQYKKGFKGLQYAAIAMAGIGASWLFVSLVFRVINFITGP